MSEYLEQILIGERGSMVKCGVCEQLSGEVRYLPCGQNLCQNCFGRIDRRLKHGSNEFQCPVCRYFHKIDEDYQISQRQASSQISNPQPRPNSQQAKTVNKLRSYLHEIQDHLDELNFKLTKRHNRIGDYFSHIRDEIDQATDELIDKIRTQNEQLKKELSGYEQDEFDLVDKRQETKKLIYEANKFHDLWLEYLESGMIENEELMKGIEASKNKIAQLESENNKLSTRLTLAETSLIKFAPRRGLEVKHNLLGKLTKESEEREKVKPSIKQRRVIDLRQYVKNINLTWNEIQVECFDDGYYLVAYNDVNSYLNCIRLSGSGGSENPLVMTDQNICSHFLIKLHRNAIVAFLSVQNPAHFLLKVFDKTFTHFNHIKCESYVISLALNDWNIFCLTNKSDNMVLMYKWDLTLVQAFGQPNEPHLDFYFSMSTHQFDIINQMFVVLDDRQMYTINGNNGKFLDSVLISGAKFCIDSNKNLIVLSYRGGNQAKLYYFKSDDLSLINEINISDYTSGLTIFIDNNDRILFFDKSRLLIYK